MLSLIKMKKLYFGADDIWNYRANVPESVKRLIVPEGKAFQHTSDFIKDICENEKDVLRNIILDEFDVFVSYSDNVNNRKLGAMWMMTALVEVSIEAATAMPYYLQNNF